MKDTPFTIAYRYISKANEALPLSRKWDTAQLSFPPHHVPLPEGNSKLCWSIGMLSAPTKPKCRKWTDAMRVNAQAVLISAMLHTAGCHAINHSSYWRKSCLHLPKKSVYAGNKWFHGKPLQATDASGAWTKHRRSIRTWVSCLTWIDARRNQTRVQRSTIYAVTVFKRMPEPVGIGASWSLSGEGVWTMERI